jgi:SAM-dependent methyltransferase
MRCSRDRRVDLRLKFRGVALMPNSGGPACDDPAMNLGQPVTTHQVERLSQSWDAHAQEWIDWVRAPSRPDSYWRFHGGHFLSLVPPAGRLTVDIGCGEGRVGRDLQKLGHRMLGVDLSFAMCRAATTYTESQAVLHADAARLPLRDGAADCAIAFMSLQDIDDMPGAIRQIARVLEDDCPLVLAIVHPMYSGGRFSGTETATGEKPDSSFVIKRSYFQPERLISTDIHGSLRVTLFREHRPLQVYTDALTNAGFNIEKLLELTDEDQSRHRDGIPLFLDILARRRPRGKSAESTGARQL